jgi:hypothetical protein
VLATSLSAHAVTVAPAGLTNTIAGTAIAAGHGTAGAFALAHKVITAMTMTKTQIAGIGAAVLAAGFATHVAAYHHLGPFRKAVKIGDAQQVEFQTPDGEPGTIVVTGNQGGGNLWVATPNGKPGKGFKYTVQMKGAEGGGSYAMDVNGPARRERHLHSVSKPEVKGADLHDAGFGTPEDGLETFYYTMEPGRHDQLLNAMGMPLGAGGTGRIDRKQMQQAYRASASAQSGARTANGEGSNTRIELNDDDGNPVSTDGTLSYRIVAAEKISDEETEYQIDRKFADGSSVTEFHTLRKDQDDWKVSPRGMFRIMAMSGPAGR